MTPQDLPDDAKVYVPGLGEVTVGELRMPRSGGLDEREATLRYWGNRATANLCRPCPSETSGATPSDRKRSIA